MADRIKGIVVEIGGNTTGLSKALSGINKEIKSMQGKRQTPRHEQTRQRLILGGFVRQFAVVRRVPWQ